MTQSDFRRCRLDSRGLWLFVGCFLLLHPGPTEAADKSGVSPTSISIPSGPGSIEGLGAEFQPNLNSGTGSYTFPIELPPGTAGRSMKLTLTYEGGNGNGSLGIGWSLSAPAIRRQCDKGIPHYDPNGRDDDFDGLTDEDDEGDRFLDPSGEELVLTDSGIYFPETQEEFVRYRYVIDGGQNHWEARQPDGTLREYGLTSAARVSENGRISKWCLERQTDTNGNVIEYHYSEFVNSDSQKYLDEIRYGPGAPPWGTFYFVSVSYEDRPDVIDDYRSGFLVRTGKRLSRIDIGLQGILPSDHLVGDLNSDGTSDVLIRRYELSYEAHPHWSLLSQVTLVGTDGVSTLPPAGFEYPIRELPRVVSAADAVIGGQNEPMQVMDNDFVDLVDLNANGLPDILKTELLGSHTAYLNEGIREDVFGQVVQWGTVQEVDSSENGGLAWLRDLSSDEVSLVDMDGDGLADLVFNPSLDPNPRYYRNKGTVSWGPQELMSVQDIVPPAPFGDPEVRTIDMNFDKRMDIVKSISNGYQVWYTLGKRATQGSQYSKAILTPGAQHQETVILFSDAGVQLADLNGDRVTDVARIRPTQVISCLSRGYGEYANSTVMTIPPDDGFGHDGGFSYLTDGEGGQIERASLRDITGDGLADLVVERAAYRELWYWVNLGNGSLTQRYIVTDLPSNFATLEPSVRWADMNGNGTTDLVYADSGLPEGERIRVVDIGVLVNGSPHPNLLTSVENGIGKRVEIEYRPSTAFAVDDVVSGYPWTRPMPNPANLVSRITIFDGLGHDYVTEFSYHEGYYDGVEREFRGFARAERRDIGDQSQPTLVSEYSFDLGDLEEALKGKTLGTVTKTEAGEVFSEEHNTWETRSLFTVLPEPEDPLDPVGVSFPYRSSRTQIVREEPGGATEPVTVAMEYAYDDYGNPVKEANYGRVDGENRNYGEDERIKWTTYSATPEAPIWNQVVETVLTDNSAPPRIVTHGRFFYDGPDFVGLPLGQLTAGNPACARSWVGPPNPPDPPQALPDPAGRFLSVTENPDHTLTFAIQDAEGLPIGASEDHWITSQRKKYDQFGNMVVIADPLAHIESGVPDPTIGHYTEMIFDESLYAFVTEERIYAGEGRVLTTQAVYDPAFGTITDAWDLNGNHTQIGFDLFSRLVRIVKPGGQPPDTPSMPTMAYEYITAASVAIAEGTGVINWVETRLHERYGDPDAYFVSRTYVDGLGRTVMVKEEDEEGGRTVVKQATTFNERSQILQNFIPFYSSRGMDFEDITAPGWTGTWIIDGGSRVHGLVDAPSNEKRYDATGRETESLHPDGGILRTEHLPLLRRVYDEEDTDQTSPHFGTPRIHMSDGLGRVIRTEEVVKLNDDGTAGLSPVIWSTEYTYNLLDKPTVIADSQGNRKLMLYDALKRKVYMDDPDRGRTWYVYDDASNLIETVDAKGQRTTYTYDGVSRLLTEDFHDEGLPFSYNRTYNPLLPISETNQPDVAYYYDVPAATIEFGDGRIGTAANTRGQIAFIVDLSGEEHTSYDERKRPIWTVKRIPDPRHGRLVSYRTELSYDALDRLRREVFPDGDLVRFEYNSRNLLERIVGGAALNADANPFVIDGIDYIPSGLLERCNYGNGAATEYSYDRRLRLNRLKTTKGADLDNPLIHYLYSFDKASNIIRIDDARPAAYLPSGNQRRNTQIFDYDDLYRLTGAQYSLVAPGEEDRNDGQIDYRYDRIGNMIWQSSPAGEGRIEQLENGRSVVNLGQMSYGASAGAWNRTGRPPGEHPGPHALTETANGGVYPYDDNGNVTEMDGVQCTWDFQDRLVAVESNQMRAEYAYDYSGRRIVKKVWDKTGSSDLLPALEPPAKTTLYISQHFEIRENDQPVKYVWNGKTRVARITGTVEPSAERVQRLRVYQGWNLLSLGVDSATAALQIAGGIGIGENPENIVGYVWDPDSKTYDQIRAADPLPAASPFWIEAPTDTIIAVQGMYTDPANIPISSEETLVPSAGLEVLSLDRALPPGVQQLWGFDSESQRWRQRLFGGLFFLSDLSDYLSPGRAIYVRTTDASAELALPPSSLRIQYYHEDHLRSAQVLTDGAGELIAETLFFPFGWSRLKYEPQALPLTQHYDFTGKEKDEESGLHYFEARYYGSNLARFLSVDPFYSNPDSLPKEQTTELLANPQHLNPYAYALNCPLRYTDPSGLEEKEGLIIKGEKEDVETWQRWMEEESAHSKEFRDLLQQIKKDDHIPVVLNVGRDTAAFIDQYITGEVDLNDLEQFDVNKDPRYPWAATRGELMLHILKEYRTAAEKCFWGGRFKYEEDIYRASHNEALKEDGAQHEYRKEQKQPGRMVETSADDPNNIGNTYLYMKYEYGHSLMVRTINGSVVRKEYRPARYNFISTLSPGVGVERLKLEGVMD